MSSRVMQLRIVELHPSRQGNFVNELREWKEGFDSITCSDLGVRNSMKMQEGRITP